MDNEKETSQPCWLLSIQNKLIEYFTLNRDLDNKTATSASKFIVEHLDELIELSQKEQIIKTSDEALKNYKHRYNLWVKNNKLASKIKE